VHCDRDYAKLATLAPFGHVDISTLLVRGR